MGKIFTLRIFYKLYTAKHSSLPTENSIMLQRSVPEGDGCFPATQYGIQSV
jgi:hypothetical protein